MRLSCLACCSLVQPAALLEISELTLSLTLATSLFYSDGIRKLFKKGTGASLVSLLAPVLWCSRADTRVRGRAVCPCRQGRPHQ